MCSCILGLEAGTGIERGDRDSEENAKKGDMVAIDVVSLLESTVSNERDSVSDKPIDYLRENIEDGRAEVDHSIDILLNRGRKLTWREVEAIKDVGYDIQDVTFPREGGDDRVRVRCVRDD